MKNTPGPWRAGRADMSTIVDGVGSKWIYSADDQYVAVASGRINGDWDEVMANAYLIAAAPKLLSALKGIVRTGCPIVTHHRPDCEWCAALLAIADAEGRSLKGDTNAD